MSTPPSSTPDQPKTSPSRPADLDDQARAARESELVIVGQVGRAHGIRGQVGVIPRTDDPDIRFVVGAVLATDSPPRGPLTITEARNHSGRLLLRFEGIEDRNGAEALRGTMLLVARGARPALQDPDDFYDSDLIGLRAVDADGTALGIVADVIHSAAADLLALDVEGREVLVPFVRQIVPVVDIAAGTLTVDAPDGLFELGL